MKYHQDLLPSAIKDWLDEELKARGIDDLEYSEYLVSLLDPETVVDGPEQELHFRQEVRKWIERRKNSSGDWWRRADPELIKRSAAMLSATDQREEMEALVEELCEKLREADGDVLHPNHPRSPSVPTDLGGLSSPEEPSESDYGSLEPDDGPICRCIEDFLKPLEQTLDDYDDVTREPARDHPPRRHDDVSMPRGPSRCSPPLAEDPPTPWGRQENASVPRAPTVEEEEYDSSDDFSMPHWRAEDFSTSARTTPYFFVPWGRTVEFARTWWLGRELPRGRPDNVSMPQGRASVGQGGADNYRMSQREWCDVDSPPSWLRSVNMNRVSRLSTAWRRVDESSLDREVAEGGGNPGENMVNGGMNNRYYSLFSNNSTTVINGGMRSGNFIGGSLYSSSFSDQSETNNRYDSAQGTDHSTYDDSSRGVSDLLAGPSRPQRNLFSSIYIPYGASITRSIWSNDQPVGRDDDSNWAINGPDPTLGRQFSSISIDTQARPSGNWPPAMPIDNNNRNPQGGFRSLPDQWDGPIDWNRPVVWERPTVANSLPNCNALSMCWECSLRQLRHDRRRSSFAEFHPRPLPEGAPSNPPARNCNQPSVAVVTEDLLESDSTHFRPIVEDESACEEYEDGTTFTASRSLLKVAFRRSDSGSLWLGDEKYHALENKVFTWPPDDRYAVKFHVCRMDEACQTDETDEEFVFDDVEEPNDVILYPSTGSPSLSSSSASPNAYPDEFAPSSSVSYPSSCSSHPSSPESVSSRPEFVSSRPGYESPYELIYNETVCENCYLEQMGRGRARSVSEIWRGGEVCQDCLYIRGEFSPPAASQQLREDIIQDGEELLSDLEFVQRTFRMSEDESSEAEESTRDVDELLVATRDLEQRDSVMFEYEDELLEEDVRIQIATANSLRSVTL